MFSALPVCFGSMQNISLHSLHLGSKKHVCLLFPQNAQQPTFVQLSREEDVAVKYLPFLLVHPGVCETSSHLHVSVFYFIIRILKFNVVCAAFDTRRLFSHPSVCSLEM